jgi:hypothetical protein
MGASDAKGNSAPSRLSFPGEWVASLPTDLMAELADDAVAAIERAHSPASDLHDLCREAGGYDKVWEALAPVLRTLRAAGDPKQAGLF